jgi:cell division protein ZapA
MNEEKLSIRVNVADRYYPLKIDRIDEEKIRRAARMINEKVLQYKQKYVDKDTQDFLAMATLQYVIRLLEIDNKSGESAVLEELKKMDEELGLYLKQSKNVL